MKKKFLNDQADFLLETLIKNGLVYTGMDGITIPIEILKKIDSNINNLESYFSNCKLASIETIKIRDVMSNLMIHQNNTNYKSILSGFENIKTKVYDKLSTVLVKFTKQDDKSKTNKEPIIKVLNIENNEAEESILRSLEIIKENALQIYNDFYSSENYLAHSASGVIQVNNIKLVDEDLTMKIERLLIDNQLEFTHLIQDIHNKSGLKQYQVARISGIHETTLSKILNGKKNDITRDMLIRLALAYRLSLAEANDLLIKKGYYLYAYNERNIIITLGIEQHCSIDEIEEALYERGLQTLSQVS